MLKNRVGETSKNKYGSIMKITKYNNARDMEVTFETGYVVKNVYYLSFKKGIVFDPLYKTNYNIGYFGIGKYTARDKAYNVWKDMFKRCYDKKYQANFNTYIGCSVCEEWFNYQVFAQWYEENYYIVENQKMQIDKDVLIKGNKVYSPKTCVILPEEVNYILLSRNKMRGTYPIGIYLHSDGDKYVAQSHDINKKMIYLGRYNTIKEAFQTYKEYKENVIKQVADKYYGIIPEKAYKALYDYKVEITD